jgi:hypothetical protein
MVRVVILVGVVLVAYIALRVILVWLTHRPNANWLYVACVVNTVLLSCLVLTIDGFRADGLTLYNLFFGGMMVWIASTAARVGTVSIQRIRAQANR